MKEGAALSHSLKRQRGAVMAYVAAMAAVLAMMVLFIYNTGLSPMKGRVCKIQQMQRCIA